MELLFPYRVCKCKSGAAIATVPAVATDFLAPLAYTLSLGRCTQKFARMPVDNKSRATSL